MALDPRLAAEINTWLAHLASFQDGLRQLIPGFIEADLKPFAHQEFGQLMPANQLSPGQIKSLKGAISALCQARHIGIPTEAALNDMNQTVLAFLNRISNVDVFAALVRLFRNVGIDANPDLGKFGEESVAGMTLNEVLGTGMFGGNPVKQGIHSLLQQSFDKASYSFDTAQVQKLLESNVKVREAARRIISD